MCYLPSERSYAKKENEYSESGMKSIDQERIEKERKQSKIRHGRGENGRKDCRMRTFVYQKERSWHKRRRMMRRLVDQNYKRCQKRERRMKRFANQKV